MADEAPGGLVERLWYWNELRRQGALPSLVHLPTREAYRRWMVVQTEGPVSSALSPGTDPYRDLINTMERQRVAGLDANDLWRADQLGEAFGAAGQTLIDILAFQNDATRERLETPAGQRLIDTEARGQVWDLVEGMYTTEEMRLAHPDFYHRFLSPEAERDALRIAEEIDRVTSPEYLGEQAEQRLYAEQDPASQWYREDLYHGQMGPDVRADYHRTAEEERLGALEELAFDENQMRLAAREALSAVDGDTWEPMPYELAADEQAAQQAFLHLGRPDAMIEIDTTDPDLGASWQAQLARLDQRLEALIQATEGQTQALTPRQGVRY